jgi:hypothetical protein
MEHWLAWAHSSHLSGGWDRDMSGYLASALVLATFCMKSMRGLRAAAIASNFAFISYAVVADIRPVLILHAILLPVNVFRFVQIEIGRMAALRAEPVLVALAGNVEAMAKIAVSATDVSSRSTSSASR